MNDADAMPWTVRYGATKNTSILIVFNADGGIFSALADALHKALSPTTYRCHLCRLTHGPFRMRPLWRAFMDELAYPVQVLHRDEFRRLYDQQDQALPAVFLDTGGAITPLVDRERIQACHSLQDLMGATSEALSALLDHEGPEGSDTHS